MTSKTNPPATATRAKASGKPVTIFQGLPGAGKSKRLIELVNAALAAGRPTLTFACADSPWMCQRDEIQRQRLLCSRDPAFVCKLNHFVSTSEAARILGKVKAKTLVVFEEAQYFAPEIALHWIGAAKRGLELLICSPSPAQKQLLCAYPRIEANFTIPCQRCHQNDASAFVVLPGQDATRSLCGDCHKSLIQESRQEIVKRLQHQAPHPGEKAIYQPVELPECAGWKVLRPDSQRRVEIMTEIFRELELLPRIQQGGFTYLDVGCNTGFFCHKMRQLGFHSEGEDVVKEDIAVAQMLDSYIRRDRNVFVARDAYEYLRDTQDRMFDVTSAFAVFQWLMIQTNADRGIACLEWLFAKTRRVCFIEMGYSAEAQYKDRLPINIDRAWVEKIMREKGGFAEVRVFPAGDKHGVSRDLFVGIKPAGLCDLAEAVRQAVPRDADVLVVSKGDDHLLKLEGRRAQHFPFDNAKGCYSGYHPADSAEAIALLEAQLKTGPRYIAFPSTGLWWLEFYASFREHLDQQGRRVWDTDKCVIYELAGKPARPRRSKRAAS
jgi:SAM-dependent methyltransferase